MSINAFFIVFLNYFLNIILILQHKFILVQLVAKAKFLIFIFEKLLFHLLIFYFCFISMNKL